MNRLFLRVLIIALISLLLGASIDSLANLETKLGLEFLFRVRGTQKPPADAVIVAMDEASETRLNVGNDLTRWRAYHAQLIRQLQRQGALLIVFDLQFIKSDPVHDPALAKAMRAAGNVLLTECVQKFRSGTQDFFGREECSESNKQPAVLREGEPGAPLSEQLVAMRKISPTAVLLESVLDHTPFFLSNDTEDALVLENWTFFDSLAELPGLPVLVWFHYLQRTGALADINPDRPFSVWLTEQRRSCPIALEASAHSKQIADLICRGDSRYLNYYGPPQTLRMESYGDVYDGKVTDLRGKVVFVGKANRQYSPGKTDFFPTPYSDSHTGKMAGVEIMATQFANLIEDRFIEIPVPFWKIYGLFGLLLALLLTRLSGWVGILASLSIGGAYAGLAVWAFGQRHWWLPVAVPLLIQLPLSWLLAQACSRYALLCERRRLLAFVQQVFPQWLAFTPASPGQWDETQLPASAERDVNGLCLATDIEGYTTIAARHSPREMWALLNDYYRVLGRPVTSRDGVIADVTGDAMMAVWFDLPQAGRRRAACLAALEIETEVAAFNRSNTLAPLATRIGLHEGELTLGRLDAGKSSHYRAIGDTVNTASRIQGVNKFLGTRILASQAIAEGLTDIVFRPVGRFRLVGRDDPCELVEIVGVADNMGAGQVVAFRQFAEGLEAFRQARWTEAARLFQDVLAIVPDDGPSRFYLALALRHSQNAELVWEGFVSLEAK